MSIVKDQNLAPAGRRKINWVRDFMPALGGIEARFEREQPFAGLRVAVSVHLEAKTANLGYVLAKGGAEVRLTGSNPLRQACRPGGEPHRRLRGDHHRHPASACPGAGGHSALPHDGGQRRQGQALL